MITHHCNLCAAAVAVFVGMFGLSLARLAVADTNLVEAVTWAVDGGIDPAPNARDIAVTVDRQQAGAFSELKIYCAVPSVGTAQVFSVTGRGLIQPALPPPGEPGGAFWLTSYWDCDQGLVGPLAITDLSLKSKVGKNRPLEMRGKVSNSNSLAAADFKLRFYPARTKSVRVEVSYRLVATRDFCVAVPGPQAQDRFRAVTMAANYVSPDVHENDSARFKRLLEKICWEGPFGDCWTRKASYCAALTNQTGYILTNSYRLGSPSMQLVHTQPLPRNTPTLAVAFRSPNAARFKPQGFLTASDDPTLANVSYWANWVDAKRSYRAGQRLARFRYTLEASAPRELDCDRRE